MHLRQSQQEALDSLEAHLTIAADTVHDAVTHDIALADKYWCVVFKSLSVCVCVCAFVCVCVCVCVCVRVCVCV